MNIFALDLDKIKESLHPEVVKKLDELEKRLQEKSDECQTIREHIQALIKPIVKDMLNNPETFLSMENLPDELREFILSKLCQCDECQARRKAEQEHHGETIH